MKSGSEPLFDLQEALGMTSNMAIFAVFRRRNGSKLKLPDPVFPPHLGVPNFFWCFWNIFMAISNGQNRDTPVSPFWSLKVTVVFTSLRRNYVANQMSSSQTCFKGLPDSRRMWPIAEVLLTDLLQRISKLDSRTRWLIAEDL